MTQLFNPVDNAPCEDCGKAQDISTEHVKMLTDRLDTLESDIASIGRNLTWLCSTVNGILQSIPRNGMTGLMMRKVLNQQDTQGQEHNGD